MQMPLNANRVAEKYCSQLYHLGKVVRLTRRPVKARMGVMVAVAIFEFWLMSFEIELTMNPIPAPHTLSSASIRNMLRNLSGTSWKPAPQ